MYINSTSDNFVVILPRNTSNDKHFITVFKLEHLLDVEDKKYVC